MTVELKEIEVGMCVKLTEQGKVAFARALGIEVKELPASNEFKVIGRRESTGQVRLQDKSINPYKSALILAAGNIEAIL